MNEYRGTEGARPYAGIGWYYAEYRQRVSREFVAQLAEHLGWSGNDRVLDLGAGPGQLSLIVAPFVAEVVALEPEPDMLAEGERRARALGIDNVTFVVAGSDDLPTLRSSLGQFRTVLMGQSFHWMVDKDRVLQDLSAMVDDSDGSVAFVKPWLVSTADALASAQNTVHEILERYLLDVPAGIHPSGRHDPFEEILARSRFPRVELIEREYLATESPTVESLVGFEYTISYVLARLGNRREQFENEVRATLGDLNALGDLWTTWRDDALIGRR